MPALNRPSLCEYALFALTLSTLACSDDNPGDDDVADETAGTDTSDTGDTGEVCEDFADIPGERSEVSFELINMRSEAIFVSNGTGCVQRPVELRRDGEWVSGLLDACQFTCSEVMVMDPPSCGCDVDCALPPVVRIEPGERYTVTWTGETFESTQMPGSCMLEEICPSVPCFIGGPAAMGSYFAQARARTEVDACYGEGGEVPCECMPGEPWCLLEAQYPFGDEPLSATQTFTHPDTAVVELVFL